MTCPTMLSATMMNSLYQGLAFDLEVELLEKQIESIQKDDLFNDNKVIIEKRRKEFENERNQIIREGDQLNKKTDKLGIAISVFLVKSAQAYQLKNKVSCDKNFVKQLLSYYEKLRETLADLFDPDKDPLYPLTQEQHDFLDFVRNQSEATTHHANMVDRNQKRQAWTVKFDDYQQRLETFHETVLRPYNQVVDHYNALKKQKNAILSAKEQRFNTLVVQVEQEAHLTEPLKAWANPKMTFPIELPELIHHYLVQLLGLEVDRLLNTQVASTAKRQLDQKKVELDQKNRECVHEKSRLIAELEKINKKQDKIDLAVGHFLAKSGKHYQPKTLSVLARVTVIKETLLSYEDEQGGLDSIELFDEKKDDAHHLSPEQKEYVNFLRSQSEAPLHYKNKIEISQKGQEVNDKMNNYNEKMETLRTTMLHDYNQAVEQYNALQEQVAHLTTQKEQLCKELMKVLGEDPHLQDALKKWISHTTL